MKLKLISVRIREEDDADLKKRVRYGISYNEHVRRAVAIYLSQPAIHVELKGKTI
jgi:hypothetical protein